MARHAFITGGGSGIGAAIAQTLGAQGAQVTLAGRDRDKLERTAHTIPGAACVTVDVGDEAQIGAAFRDAQARFGPVAILVNSAGISPSAPFLKTNRAMWDEMLQVNLTGAFLCTQAALPNMLSANWGRIVNVASITGLKGAAYISAYCASKHGLIGMTRALAQELAKTGVTANALCPGFVDTPMTDRSADRIAKLTKLDAQAARTRLAESNPSGRLVTADEVAAAAAFLCSDEAASINGASIPIGGDA